MAPTMDIKEIVDSKEIVEAHPMNSGDGPTSYAQNSCYQKGVIDAAKGVIDVAISENLEIESSNPFRIADFGCSTGPNTFLAIRNIVQGVERKYQYLKSRASPGEGEGEGEEVVEFHVFFNDHVDNDFNILFRSLPPYSYSSSSGRRYFAAGVPGSFYSRLLPKGSLHFAHSSYALHWLTKVPSELQDKNSPAWNKGKIHYTGTDKQVTNAYFSQFEKDMGAFLKARAEELVGGGLMLILLPGIPNGALFSQTGAGMIHSLLGSCLLEMANMGTISEDTLDSFNLPQYHPSIEELEMLIEMNNCFSIQRTGALNHPFKHLPFDVKMTCTQVRAIMEGLITQHFGNHIVDQLFHLFSQKLADNYFVFDKEIHKDVDLFILLKRKTTA